MVSNIFGTLQLIINFKDNFSEPTVSNFHFPKFLFNIYEQPPLLFLVSTTYGHVLTSLIGCYTYSFYIYLYIYLIAKVARALTVYLNNVESNFSTNKKKKKILAYRREKNLAMKPTIENYMGCP